MLYNEVLDRLQKLINKIPTQAELMQILEIKQSTMSERARRNSKFYPDEISKLNEYYGVNLFTNKSQNNQKTNCIPITYLPDVYLSAGYGVENYDDEKSSLMIDAALLITERGNKINPKYCEIVKISGNSMAPEYRHGDRVIIDRNDTNLQDGHIFAINYKGQCFVKEINLCGDRIKCISLNKEYDPFYINSDDCYKVIGRILPRIRL